MRVLWRFMLITTVIFIYVPFFIGLANEWASNPYAGHGVFVPLFCAFLLWSNRRQILSRQSSNSHIALLFSFLALSLLLLGYWLGNLFLGTLSFVIATAAFITWRFGLASLKTVKLPIAFLLLMYPLPQFVVDWASPSLKLFAASVSSQIAKLFDIPCYQSGTLIALPQLTIEVVDACNGLRFLMALFTLSVALAHITQRSLWAKFTLSLFAIPLAVTANTLRVATITLAAHYIGPQAVSGLIHHSIGKILWLLTLLPLGALAGLLWHTSVAYKGSGVPISACFRTGGNPIRISGIHRILRCVTRYLDSDVAEIKSVSLEKHDYQQRH